MVIGTTPGAFGYFTIDGAGSRCSITNDFEPKALSETLITNGGLLEVGGQTIIWEDANVFVNNGGTLRTAWLYTGYPYTGLLQIGPDGTLHVTGPVFGLSPDGVFGGNLLLDDGASLIVDGRMDIDAWGGGWATLDIDDATASFGDDVTLGRSLGTQGRMIVDDAPGGDERVTIAGSLHIGGASEMAGGVGEVVIELDGKLDADRIIVYPGGTMDLDGGGLRTRELVIDGGIVHETIVPRAYITDGSIGGVAGFFVDGDETVSLTIKGGGLLSTRFGVVGHSDGGRGLATVTGTGSDWYTDELRIGNGIVGFDAIGRLEVLDGGTVEANTTIDVENGGTLYVEDGNAVGLGADHRRRNARRSRHDLRRGVVGARADRSRHIAGLARDRRRRRSAFPWSPRISRSRSAG